MYFFTVVIITSVFEKNPAAFPPTAVSWLFPLVKQKLSSEVAKLEEFKKNKYEVK